MTAADPKDTPRVALIRTGELDKPESRTVPPLGCMYLAAVLREELGARCRILDPRLYDMAEHQVLDWLAERPTSVVGLSVTTVESAQMHHLAAGIKRRLPEVPIVVGGPHAMTDKQEILTDQNIDYVVYGEGERTAVELIDALHAEGPVENILGLAYRAPGVDGDMVVVNPPRPYIDDLDALPHPAWDLIDSEAYHNRSRGILFYKHRRYMPIFSSRACPHRCVYCHSIFGKKFRARSPESVLAEMRLLYNDLGIRDFEFYDDCFNASLRRAKEILRLFAASEMRDANIQFPNGLRADHMDDELIDLMHRARTFSISIGVETASPRLQKLIRKKINLEKLKDSVSKISDKGILIHAFFMFGFPTETREEMLQTLQFACDIDIDTASFFIVNPFKDTEIIEIAREQGIDVDTRPASYDFLRMKNNLSNATDTELHGMMRKAHIDFYLSRKRVRKGLRVVRRCPRIVLEAPKTLIDRMLRH